MNIKGYLESWKRIVLNVANLLVLIVISSCSTSAQTEEKTDSVYVYFEDKVYSKTDSLFVLFDPELNYKVESAKPQYYRPDLRYPNDVLRTFMISQFEYCSDCDPPEWKSLTIVPFQFSTISAKSSEGEQLGYLFEEISIEDFEAKNPLKQEWFNKADWHEINKKCLRAKHIFLVDKSHLRDGKYIMLKVSYWPNYVEDK